MVLVLSDVHLGALHTKRSIFERFLTLLYDNLKENKLPNLKALIILGDCFDLIMDTHKDILTFGVYQKILERFNQFYEMEGFHLIFALGNHEVPVIGNYDKDFFENKKNMLNEFDYHQNEENLNYSFFNKDIFSQYVLLQQEGFGDLKPVIKLFDTKQDIVNHSPINTHPLDIRAPSSEYNNYLMSHGFQFDPQLDKYSLIWNMGLSIPFNFIKEIGDGIWNGFFKRIYTQGKRIIDYVKNRNKIEKATKKESKKYMKTNTIKVKDDDKLKIYENVKVKCESDEHREAIRDNQECINEIVNFIPNLMKSGYYDPINHVIYGHTHDRLRPISKWFQIGAQPQKQQYQIEVEYLEHKYSISNTGAWQHVKKPSFIEIHTDWKVIPKVIPIVIGDVEQVINRKVPYSF